MNSFIVSLKSMRRNLTMTLVSIILVFLTVFMGGIVGIITSNTAYASKEAVNNLTIYVRVEPTASEEQTQEVINNINNLENIENIDLTNKTDALNNFANDLYPDDPNKLLSIFGGSKNPLSDELKVKVKDANFLETTYNEIITIPNVKNASVGDNKSIANFIDVMKKISLFSLILALILVTISIFIIINTIKINIVSRKLEIEIMRLVGGTKNHIRFPFVWEGMFLGLVGGLFAYIILYYGYKTIFENMNLIGSIKSLFISPELIRNPLFLLVVVFSMLIGAIGSYIATAKYLKK